MPKVSIIMNCHNGEQYLKRALKSIKDQTFTDYEIIFWDNCSTDSSADIARSFDARLKYYRGRQFVPLGKARNQAFGKTTGQYVAFIDCDDIWDRKKLAMQVEAMDSDGNCGMVFTNFKRLNMLSKKTDLYEKNAVRRTLSFSQLVGNYSFCLSSFMVRGAALQGLGHLFEDKFKYAEEFELFSRIAYNWDTIYLPDPLVTYRIHNNMNTMQLQDRIAVEYDMALRNLRKMDPDMDKKFPEVVKRISFARDLFRVKDIARQGKNKKVRELMKPYLGFNVRAGCFYCAALMPPVALKQIVKVFYRKRI